MTEKCRLLAKILPKPAVPRIAAFAAWQTYYVRAQVRGVRYSVNYRYRRTKISRGRVRPRAIYASRFIRCRYVRNVHRRCVVIARGNRWKNE